MPCGACGCACSEAPREELEAPLLTDIETGPGHITAAPPDGVVDEPTDAEMDNKGDMIFCCICRGLLALLYLYLVDLLRRYILPDDGGYNLNNVFYVVFPAAFVGMYFCEFCANVRAPSEVAGGRISG